MEGNKTTARRSSRTGSTRPAAAAEKKAATATVGQRKTAVAEATEFVTPEERRRMVEMAAYFRAEHRGFAAGYEVIDWLAAEAEIDAILLAAPEGQPVPKGRKPKSG